MTALVSLWLPIVAAVLAVYIASAIINTVMPWHQKDFPPVPDEEGMRRAIGAFQLAPGEYSIPRALDNKEMGSPEFRARMVEGPNVMLTVRPNVPMSMTANLVQWLVYCIVATIVIACVTTSALHGSTDDHAIFHFAAVTAFLCYAGALWQGSIWYSRPWISTLKNVFDGAIYALLTAVMFMWLWP